MYVCVPNYQKINKYLKRINSSTAGVNLLYKLKSRKVCVFNAVT